MKLRSYFLRMGLSMFVILGICLLFSSSLMIIFWSNPGLNALIISLTLAGILYAFYQLLRLKNDGELLENLKHGEWNVSSSQPAIFLEPIILFFQQKNVTLDPSIIKRLGESLADRLDNERVIPRYLIGLLVFLGLLGTFWGLSQTIASIAKLIQNMPSDGGSSVNFFDLLKENLQTPLIGMGTAFGSSLFGLGGSILVGFLELQVGHAYSRFLNETDFYLITCTHEDKLASAASAAPFSFLKALLTSNIESIEKLTQLIEKSEKGHQQKAQSLDKLIQSLSLISDQNKTQQNLMVKLAEGQIHLQTYLATFPSHLGEEKLKCLQNIDRSLIHSLQHQREEREEFLKRVKDEMRLITRTLASVSEQQKLVG